MKNSLVVHEWGTFLSLSSSSGTILDGMYHEEHALPSFVHSLQKDRLQVPQARIKGETPVIYFYTDEPLVARVQVRFPKGRWTHWFPQASVLGGSTMSTNDTALKGDLIGWKVRLSPPDDLKGIPAAPDDLLWKHTRGVPNAATVTMDQQAFLGGKPSGEKERFLFYRGLGATPLPVRFSAENGGTLLSQVPLRHVFIVRTEKGQVSFRHLPTVLPGQRLSGLIPDYKATGNLPNDLHAALVDTGLFPDEATGMVRTWQSSWLGTEGVRALFLLPQSWTDTAIPINIYPKPTSLVRVMLGRIELLTPTREQAAAKAVLQASSADANLRQIGNTRLRAEGRYLESILRHLHNTHSDTRVRAACEKLLKTSLVA
ncbi:MAG: hypothetical protein QM758_24755 [Armatimonas sp.]